MQWLRFQQCLDSFTMLHLERYSETGLLDIYLTTVFGVRNLQNTSGIRVIFFWKRSKFYQHFKNVEKKSGKKIFFWDDCIWICCVKLSLLRREYLWQAVNVLKNSPTILPITKRDFFELNFLHSDEWIC